jgi:hypothetical protein
MNKARKIAVQYLLITQTGTPVGLFDTIGEAWNAARCLSVTDVATCACDSGGFAEEDWAGALRIIMFCRGKLMHYDALQVEPFPEIEEL